MDWAPSRRPCGPCAYGGIKANLGRRILRAKRYATSGISLFSGRPSTNGHEVSILHQNETGNLSRFTIGRDANLIWVSQPHRDMESAYGSPITVGQRH